MNSDWTGDIVVAFSAEKPSAGRGPANTWTPIAESAPWRLWQQPASSEWKGFPFRRIEAAGWWIMLLGELYTPANVAEVVSGQRSAADLNGHFLLWAWDEKKNEWHVWTDRFGTLHAYHARRLGAAAVGTCSGTVAQLASRRRLDNRALAGFFGLGFFPLDRTFFEDMRILRPATHYVFSAAGDEISASRYWDWNYKPDVRRTYEDTVAEFASVFGAVMRGMVREGRIALPISGGLDSRCTVAAIDHPSVWAYSYGYTEDSAETKIARQVAAARNLPMETFAMQPYLFDQLGRVLACVEGFQDVTQCRQAAVTQNIAAHADFIIAAHLGDVWLDAMGQQEARGDLFHKMAKKGRAWLQENICAPMLGEENPEAVLRQFVDEGMKQVEHIQDAEFRAKACKIGQWSFRWTTTSLRMFQCAAFPRLPFYDTRLADFFSTVPSEFLPGRRLQVDYLKRFAPDLARVKWQPYDANLYQYRHYDSWLLPKRAVKRGLRMLKGEKVIERNWEVQFGGKSGEAGLSHWLLRPGLRLHDLVDRKKVAALLADFRVAPPEQGLGWVVSMLLTFSAWLESNV